MNRQTRAWMDWFRVGKGKRESLSGVGSSLENTREIRAALPEIIRSFGITSMADVPCGDFWWMKEVDLSGVEYVGYDVVEEQIEANRAMYPGFSFGVLDVVREVPARADLILMRDFLFHLTNEEVNRVLENVRDSGSRYFMATHFPNEDQNFPDVSHGGRFPPWRPLNLFHPPFSLHPVSLFTVQENFSSGCRGRVLDLWECESM